MNYQTYVVSLKKATERRRYISEHLKTKLQFNFFDAVDGANISSYIKSFLPVQMDLYQRGTTILTKSEIGCALSHIGLFERLLDSKCEFFVIFEDDIHVDKAVVELLSEISGNFSKGWDVLFLGQHPVYSRDLGVSTSIWQRKTLLNKYEISRPVENCYGTYGYLVSRSGAEKLLLKINQLDKPIDHFTGDTKLLKLYALKNPLVTIHSLMSDSFHSMQDREVKLEEERERKATVKVKVLRSLDTNGILYRSYKLVRSFKRLILRFIKSLRRF